MSPATIPESLDMETTEVLPIGFDFTGLIQGSEVPSSPQSVLATPDGQIIALSDSPTVSGNVVTQVVRGSALEPRSSYVLIITAHLDTNNIQTMVLKIRTDEGP